MRKRFFAKILTAVLAVFILEGSITAVFAQETAKPAANQAGSQASKASSALKISAPSAVLMESLRGQILYRKDASQRLHISTANKIMATLVVIEKTPDLSAMVTISKESAGTEGSALSLEVGEKYSVEDLLYAVMLSNANDAAMALAEFVGGGNVEKFVALMNDKAHELNLVDTHFTNPTGLYDENQYTTALDLALLTKYAISVPAFNRIFSYQAKPWIEKDGSVKVLTSQNQLFWSYEGVDGGKTGFNEKDKQTAVTTATKDGQRLICVVLDAPEKTVFEDSARLLDYGFENFRMSLLVPSGYPQNSVQVGGVEVNLISRNDIYYTHPIGENYIKSLEFKIAENLNPPITRDRIIGTARYILNDDTIIDVNLYPDREILVPEDFKTTVIKKLNENRDILYLLAVLVAVEAILILYNIIRLIVRIIRKIFKREVHAGSRH